MRSFLLAVLALALALTILGAPVQTSGDDIPALNLAGAPEVTDITPAADPTPSSAGTNANTDADVDANSNAPAAAPSTADANANTNAAIESAKPQSLIPKPVRKMPYSIVDPTEDEDGPDSDADVGADFAPDAEMGSAAAAAEDDADAEPAQNALVRAVRGFVQRTRTLLGSGSGKGATPAVAEAAAEGPVLDTIPYGFRQLLNQAH